MFKLSRLLIGYAIAVPLALILGYLVSSPDGFTFAAIGLLLFFFSLPLLLKWHHVLMIVFWNSVFNFFFLPGHPDAWLLFGLLSFAISLLNHILFQRQFLHAPELTRPLLVLMAVVLVTAWIRGGIGIRAMGGAVYGGRNYVLVLGAIAGYFAFTSERIPIFKSGKMTSLFFLSGLSYAVSNVVYVLGPAFYFMYNFVPSGTAAVQAASDFGLTTIDRIEGLSSAAIAVLCFLLARYGIRGLFDLSKPWRFALLLAIVAASLFAGFRSAVLILFLIFIFQFYFEGLVHTHYLPIVVGLAICGVIPLLFLSDSMPSSVQRAISFLPVNVDSEVLEDAKSSSEWRFGMWTDVVTKEVPKYLIIGKGYSVDPAEMIAAVQAARTGNSTTEYEGSMIAGDYHSGPLSILVPFGIFGVITFLWVLMGGYRVLSRNYRYGDPRLRRINTTLLAYYLTNCITYFALFGSFSKQLYVFLGICGLSISLNGGVRRRTAIKKKAIPEPQTLVMEPG